MGIFVVRTAAVTAAKATVHVAAAVAKKTVSAAKGVFDVACKVTSTVGRAVGNVLENVGEGIRTGVKLLSSLLG